MATVASVLAELKRRGSGKWVDGLERYGIVVANNKVFGVSVGDLRDMGKQIGKDHKLALALWKSGWYEARNFVKKAVSWALRGIGKRQSPSLKKQAPVVARRLAKSEDSTARWI